MQKSRGIRFSSKRIQVPKGHDVDTLTVWNKNDPLRLHTNVKGRCRQVLTAFGADIGVFFAKCLRDESVWNTHVIQQAAIRKGKHGL